MIIETKLILMAAGASVSAWWRIKRHFEERKASRDQEQEPDDADADDADERAWLNDMPGVSEQATVDQNLMIGKATLGVTIGTHFFGVPSLVAVPFLGAATLPIVVNSTTNLRKGERIGSSILDLFAGLIVVFTDQYLAVAITAFSYHWGQKLLIKTEDRSARSLLDVFEDRPQTVWVERENGVEIQLPLADLQTGDVVVIEAGQVVPVDGVIVSGSAWIDQRALTGESQPAEKIVGDDVLASTFVVEGRAGIRVEQTGLETTAQRIYEIMQHTDDFKSSMLASGERTIDQWSWPTIGLSAVAGTVGGYQSTLAMNYAAIGYSARLGMPLSILNHLHLASEDGILIKDGRSLELMGDIDTIVFDKTGTLTEEIPAVGQIIACSDDYSEDELLRLVAAAEEKQTHPIARAIQDEATRRQLTVPSAQVQTCRMGFGLQVRLDEQTVTVGSARLMEMEQIPIPRALSSEYIDAVHDGCASLVYVAVEGKLVGAIELVTALRPNAAQVVATLQAKGLQVYILSGDREAPTRRLAEQLGVTGYFAETLPVEKAQVIDELRDEGRTICFVGDGINDVIALKKAHVSISMSGASTVAIDTAAVVLLDASLDQLLALFELGHDMRVNLDRGKALAVWPGIASAGGILFFGVGILGASLMYNISAFLCIGNGFLPLWQRRQNAPQLPPARALSVPRSQTSRTSRTSRLGGAEETYLQPPETQHRETPGDERIYGH